MKSNKLEKYFSNIDTKITFVQDYVYVLGKERNVVSHNDSFNSLFLYLNGIYEDTKAPVTNR